MAAEGDPGGLSAGERHAIYRRTHAALRPDIDGLRAIAVLPVILFHAHVRGFSGGFVGVDIFFVISGYLITGILVRDIAIDRYSISEFYRRRILRIFPALMAMLVVTSFVAWQLLLPVETGRYADGLAGTALFVSNIVFYRQTDYFNLGAVSQPLLHTWSLAVEEQWYILWPLLLVAVGPRRPHLMRALAFAITLASFAFCLWLLPRDAPAAFYLLPSRAWELGMGAILAMIAGRVPRGRLCDGLAAAGLAMILVCVKVYTKDTSFPGLAAVPPCLGAALLLHCGQTPNAVARLLSVSPLRFIGAISYSLYLWHWPVIVFAETGLFLAPGLATMIGILTTMLLLATLSWRFVEQPFRIGVGNWPTAGVLWGGAAAIGAAVVLAVASPAIERATSRFTSAQTGMAAYLDFDGDAAYRRDVCFKVGERSRYDAGRCLATSGTRPALLFVGDSHAAMLWPGLSRHRDHFDIVQATATGCVAMLYPADDRQGCPVVINAALRGWLAHHRPAALILASHWQPQFLGGVEATLRDPAIRAAHPVLIGPLPQYSTGLPRLLVAAERRRDPGLPARSSEGDVFALDAAMRAMAARTGTPYVSLVDLLCDGRVCRTLAAPGVPLQFDGSHLTTAGSRLVVDAILPRIMAPSAR